MFNATVTSQGQITIPAEIRRQAQATPATELQVWYDAETQEIRLKKPLTVKEFSSLVKTILPPKNIPPLTNVHEFYEIERTKDLMHGKN